jgi:hypothetical protein
LRTLRRAERGKAAVAAASGATTAKFAPATKAAAKAAHPVLADKRRGARSGAARKQEVGLERKVFFTLQFREKMRNLVNNRGTFVMDAKYFAKRSAFQRKCSIFVKIAKNLHFIVLQFLQKRWPRHSDLPKNYTAKFSVPDLGP